MRKVVGIGLAALVALVVAGFILGGYLDATGASSIPGLPWLMHQPLPLRIVIELVVGVPIAFGIGLVHRPRDGGFALVPQHSDPEAVGRGAPEIDAASAALTVHIAAWATWPSPWTTLYEACRNELAAAPT
jgi:hypothetical protein